MSDALNENARRYARATGSAQASLCYIRSLARFPHITSLDEIIAATEKAEIEIERCLRGEG
jgi:ABC-type phosphate transport system ATPase subunit